jgi:hypothetical protein
MTLKGRGLKHDEVDGPRYPDVMIVIGIDPLRGSAASPERKARHSRMIVTARSCRHLYG